MWHQLLGLRIHSAIHGAREDAHYIAHFRSADGVTVSAHAEGLLPLNQRALTLIPASPTTTMKAWRSIWTSGSWELPQPAVLLGGPGRVVQLLHVSPDWLDRPEAQNVIRWIDSIQS